MNATVTTRGVGHAAGTADAMLLSVAIVRRSAAVSDALAGTASGVSALGEVTRRFTSPEHITSQGLHVWPHHDNDGRPVGYEARHTLTVFCPDLVRAGELVTALGTELEDRLLIEGVEPVIADPSPLADLARERAWSDARRKADQLAELAGGFVVGPTTLVEGSAAGEPIPVRAEMFKADTVTFEAGSQSVSASLTVTWAMAGFDLAGS